MPFNHWIQAFLGAYETQGGKAYPGIVLRLRKDSVLFCTFEGFQEGSPGILQWGHPPRHVKVLESTCVQNSDLKATLLELKVEEIPHNDLYAMRKNEQLATALLFDQEDRLTQSLQDIRFPYDALMNVSSDRDISCSFLGRAISCPVYIVGMTGGSPETDEINRLLSAAAAKAQIPMAVGSQRWVLEGQRSVPLRKIFNLSEQIPLIGNLGVAEVLQHGVGALKKLQSLTGVDAVAIHLNIFQELMQWEGTHTFSDTLSRLQDAVNASPVPIILKETGCGFSQAVMDQVCSWKLYGLELTSTAGTNWVSLEGMRSAASFDQQLAEEFSQVGHDAKSQVGLIHEYSKKTKGKTQGPKLVASGGVTQGVHVAKWIYAGADMCSLGRAVLRLLHQHDGNGDVLESYFNYVKKSLKLAMVLTQKNTLEDFRGSWNP